MRIHALRYFSKKIATKLPHKNMQIANYFVLTLLLLLTPVHLTSSTFSQLLNIFYIFLLHSSTFSHYFLHIFLPFAALYSVVFFVFCALLLLLLLFSTTNLHARLPPIMRKLVTKEIIMVFI